MYKNEGQDQTKVFSEETTICEHCKDGRNHMIDECGYFKGNEEVDPGFENTSDQVTTCICGVPGCDGFSCGNAPTPTGTDFVKLGNDLRLTYKCPKCGADVEVNGSPCICECLAPIDEPEPSENSDEYEPYAKGQLQDYRNFLTANMKQREDRGSDSYNDVQQPSHYTGFILEPITFIMVNDLSAHVAAIVKYACRAGLKTYPGLNAIESEIKDLEKARRYAEMRIRLLKGEGIL